MLRKACEKDISRIAEILIFAKRVSYRPIFENDEVSFNSMQVLTEAENLKQPHMLDNVFVYDDGIVRGMMKRECHGKELKLCELFIDPFFQNLGIGKKILTSLSVKPETMAVCAFTCGYSKKIPAPETFMKNMASLFQASGKNPPIPDAIK